MKKFLFLGDSITDCYHSFDTDNLGEGYVRMIAETLGYGFGKAIVRNLGYDGFTMPALKRLWNRISDQIRHTYLNSVNNSGSILQPASGSGLNSSGLSACSPDFITILIGINDVGIIKNTGTDPVFALEEFKIGYKTLIEQIKETCSCPILLMEPFIFPHPAEYAAWEPELHKMNDIIKVIAETYHIGYLPLWDRLSDAAQKHGFHAITIDGIHLTSQGHRILADAWLDYYNRL